MPGHRLFACCNACYMRAQWTYHTNQKPLSHWYSCGWFSASSDTMHMSSLVCIPQLWPRGIRMHNPYSTNQHGYVVFSAALKAWCMQIDSNNYNVHLGSRHQVRATWCMFLWFCVPQLCPHAHFSWRDQQQDQCTCTAHHFALCSHTAKL